MTVITVKAVTLSFLLRVWGHVDAQVTTIHMLAVMGMVRSWNSVTWGASGSVLVSFLCGPMGAGALFPEAKIRGLV